MAGIADWIKINGQGIYSSRVIAPYSENNIFYTQSKNKKSVYAYVLSEAEEVKLPATLQFKLNGVKGVKKVSLLGSNKNIKWQESGGIVTVNVPVSLQNNSGLKNAAAFKLDYP
ncbi:alpha-L-fucosidase C-terminal domain-containing protein [Mucilaginibacter robiniae]|uniref:alpha-L-fucosidase C-terminal domain-containing protein n=1 Tax=Mucilaginibacter robiniae TaxID=2728022 RepID=UPI002006E923|nr:alpha-L-fucosidase C-terminal domain-containing protein [Mucilaginibacter robiniae]